MTETTLRLPGKLLEKRMSDRFYVGLMDPLFSPHCICPVVSTIIFWKAEYLVNTSN